jgi:hypothetical protein
MVTVPNEQSDNQMRLLAAAHHEAGHAVAGRHFGWRIHQIVIDPDDVRGGATLIQPDEANWRQRVLVALAGDAARMRFDTTGAFEVNEYEIHTAQHDWSAALEVLSELSNETDPDSLIDERFNRWQAIAEQLVARPLIWAAIVAVAEALRDANWRLDGESAENIIDRASSTRVRA